MSVDAPLEIVGRGHQGLRRAADLAKSGTPVVYREPGLRAGGRLITESFLTPFRFNLGPALVHRRLAGAVPVIEPDLLVAVAAWRLGRDARPLSAAETVAATLDASEVDDPETRAVLTALALLLGIDPDAPWSGAGIVQGAADLADLVLVGGGNGSIPAAWIDEIVAAGGTVIEGLSPWQPEPPLEGSLGTCRLFVGVRGAGPSLDAFATAYGFSDESSLLEGLSELRHGRVGSPLGFVLSNAHLDSTPTTGAITSFVWQGPVPSRDGAFSRYAYIEDVLAAVGVDERDVIFRLLWLPAETREILGGTPSYLDS
ncbi:MAG: hypothetical protein H0X39_04580 [Actinobacteria bacterium]|nr:hypothetical protein [Actinomycetota bacterium]